jgi:ubiquinone biosynthesis protein UbiJ
MMSNAPFTTLALKAFNHVLKQESWAQDLLIKHESKHIEIKHPFGKLGITITHGFLSPTEEVLDSQPAVCFEISQEAIWAFLGNGKSAAMKYLRISGDVELAADLNRLATDLHWELEEDLSKIIGDQAAFAVHQQAKKVVEQGQEAVKDLQVGVRDYLVFEKEVLLGKNQFDEYKSQLRTLRDQLERTEKRIQRLEQELSTRSVS